MRRILPFLLLCGATLAAEDPLDPARGAFVKGQYQKAIELARPQLATNPLQAWRLIGASSCFLKDRNTAKEAYGKIDPEGRAFLKYVCSRNGVTLP